MNFMKMKMNFMKLKNKQCYKGQKSFSQVTFVMYDA